MFAVWFLDASIKTESIVGLANSWSRAEEMAKNLYSIKSKVDDLSDVSTGIFFLDDSILYTSSKPRRWQITPLLSSDNDRMTT